MRGLGCWPRVNYRIMAPTRLSPPDGLLPMPSGASPQQAVRHGGALATLVAGRRALLMLVVESTLLALAGRVNDAADGSRSATAPARACSAGAVGSCKPSSGSGRPLTSAGVPGSCKSSGSSGRPFKTEVRGTSTSTNWLSSGTRALGDKLTDHSQGRELLQPGSPRLAASSGRPQLCVALAPAVAGPSREAGRRRILRCAPTAQHPAEKTC